MRRIASVAVLLTLSFMISCKPADKQPSEAQEQKFANGAQTLDTEKAHLDRATEMLEAYSDIKTDKQLGAQCVSGIRVPDPSTDHTVALTFDDGPHPVNTDRILRILKKYDVKASFFTLGKSSIRYPEIMNRIIQEGHVLGNHSFSHPNFKVLKKDQVYSQIKSSDVAIKPYFGKLKWFRFPFGSENCYAEELLKALKYQPVVGWHIDSCDWAMADGKFSLKEAVICAGRPGPVSFSAHVMAKYGSRRGGISLFHDTVDLTNRNLEALIVSLKNRNYKFVTIDDVRYFPILNSNLIKIK